jgi:hypothetical protein
MKTQNEIIEQGYQALVDSLGILDAIRFIQHFSPGEGNYTEERYQWLQQKSLDDIFKDIPQNSEDNSNQYQETID